jgi:hypothetical protein
MSLVAEQGVISSPTVTGNMTKNLGSAFNGILPKLLFLWTSDYPTPNQFAPNAIMSLGFGTYDGGSAQQYFLSSSAFPTDPSNAVRAKGSTAILKPFNADSTTPNAEYDLVSFNSGTPSSFVLNVADAPSTAIKLHYLVLGGTDIAKARVGSFTVNTTISTQDVTIASGWGQPDLLWFLGVGFADTVAFQGNLFGDLGIAASASVRRATSFAIAEATSGTYASWQKQRAVVSCGTAGSEDVEGDLSAQANYPTDGFEFNWLNPSSGAVVMGYVAMQGDFQAAIGVNSTLTTGSEQDNACGFAPVAGGVFGSNMAPQTTPYSSGTGLGAFMFGASDGANESCIAFSVDDGLASNARYDRRHSETKGLLMLTPETPSVEAEADLSFSGNNLHLSYTTLSSVGREYIWWAIGAAPAGGQTVQIGAATTVHSAQAVGKAKAKAIVAPSQVDTPQALGRAKLKVIGQATTVQSAQALGRVKTRAITQATTAHLAQTVLVRPLRVAIGAATTLQSAQAFARLKTRAITAPTTTHAAQALGRAKLRVIAVVTQAQSVQTFGRLKAKAIAAPTQPNTPQQLGRLKTRAVAAASTTHLAQTVARLKTRTIAAPVQPNTAQQLGRAKLKAIAAAQTVQLAQTMGRRKTRAVTAATVTHAAQAFQAAGSKLVTIGQATQPQSVQTLGRAKLRAVAAASTAHSAQTLGRLKLKAISAPTQPNAAQTLGRAKLRAITAPSTLHSAQTFGRKKLLALGSAAQANTAQPFQASGNKVVAVGTVTQANSAQGLGRAKLRAVVAAVTAHSAQLLGRRKTAAIGQATQPQAAQQLGRLKTRAIAAPTQPTVVQGFAKAKRLALGQATITQVARQLVMPKRIVIGPATTQHVARNLTYVPAFLPLGRAVGGTDRQEVAGEAELVGQGEGASQRDSAGRGVVTRTGAVAASGRAAGARGKVRRT